MNLKISNVIRAKDQVCCEKRRLSISLYLLLGLAETSSLRGRTGDRSEDRIPSSGAVEATNGNGSLFECDPALLSSLDGAQSVFTDSGGLLEEDSSDGAIEVAASIGAIVWSTECLAEGRVLSRSGGTGVMSSGRTRANGAPFSPFPCASATSVSIFMMTIISSNWADASGVISRMVIATTASCPDTRLTLATLLVALLHSRCWFFRDG